VTRDATGDQALVLATRLLQRARRVDPEVGVWEASDVQWWSRRARPSDPLPQRFWVVEDHPVAVAKITWWTKAWGLDLLVVPGAPVDHDEVWDHGWRQLLDLGATTVESLVRVDDAASVERLVAHGFAPGGDSGVVRSDAPRAVASEPLPDGYRLVDRSTRPDGPHWLVRRNEPDVEDRLRRCSLYQPSLDLAVLAADGTVAGYALCWADPVTGVGTVEPVRVEDEHSGRGVARAMVGAGLDRLERAGARRLQIGWEEERPRRLYRGLGLVDEVPQRTYRFEAGEQAP
jgi:GNAT superfamily N-acetyltransferase